MIGEQASDVEDAVWVLLSYSLTNQKRVIPITQLLRIKGVTSRASFLPSSPPPRLLFLTAGGPLLGCAVLSLLFSTRYPEGRSAAGSGPFGVAQGHGRD